LHLNFHQEEGQLMEDIIEKFIEIKKVGLVGVSRDSKKWGNMLFRALKKKGYIVYPVNPNAEEIMGEKCFPSIKELPKDVENIILSVPPDITNQVIKDCISANIKRVWMHGGVGGSGSHTEEAIKYCEDNEIDVVYGLCPLMFIPPAGIHRLHFWFNKLFGKLPAEYKAKS